MPGDRARWLLDFTSANVNAPDGDGRPWGDATEMSARARAGVKPWDEGCTVTTFIGGYAAMRAMRQSLLDAITWARALPQGQPPLPGQRGHVWLTDWRLNALRDVSDGNVPWQPTGTSDPTAIGLLLQLMQAGIRLRILVWYPLGGIPAWAADLGPHIADHRWIAEMIEAENKRLMPLFNMTEPLGVVGLDVRVAELSPPAASHHQKSMIIRAGPVNVAFCGGVDLAHTRRDAPDTPHPFDPTRPSFLGGDWQSGSLIPAPTRAWPRNPGMDYSSVLATAVPTDQRQPSDLPANIYDAQWQIWHDQHLRLTGPIISTIESQFSERWRDTAAVYDQNSWLGRQNYFTGQVIFSTPFAFDSNGNINPLTRGPAITPDGTSDVQMWRTIPVRGSRFGTPFKRAEFTIMAGLVKAIKAARQLIWMFDQYFWSRPLARLLNAQVKLNPNLCVIIILPPHADSQAPYAHRARQLAFTDLVDGLTLGQRTRVLTYNLWHPSRKRGIYCHAKTHTYDGSLLVCGSANLNRRSFTCDTELAMAVLDQAVVADHQRRLWGLLFPSAPWPGLDLETGGPGFISQFVAAARMADAFVIADPWQDSAPALPTDPPTPRDQNPGVKYGFFYNNLLDPSSLDTKVENDVRDASGQNRPARLDDIVRRLENGYYPLPNGKALWPWRPSGDQ